MLQGFKAELFKALAHPVRIRILELLRSGEQSVSYLQSQLDASSPAISQQLAVLRARQLVTSRKEGASVYYRVVDSRVFDLLDVARAMFEQQAVTLRALLDEEPVDADHDSGRSLDSRAGLDG